MTAQGTLAGTAEPVSRLGPSGFGRYREHPFRRFDWKTQALGNGEVIRWLQPWICECNTGGGE